MNTLPPLLAGKLAEFRRRVWVVKGLEGVLAGLFGLLVSYGLVFAMDRFFDTPGGLRLGVLVLGAAVLGIGLPLKWHRWVWRQRRLEDAARLLRRTFPRLGDQLLGIVELARMEAGTGGRSERLVQAAMAQADEEVKDRDFRQAVPEARHRHWAMACGAAALLVVVVFGSVNEAAVNALARWAMPWRATERFTFARVEVLPDPWVVPYAEPVDLKVRLSEAGRWKPAVARAAVPDQPVVKGARDGQGEFVLPLPPQKEDTVLRFTTGDVREAIVVQPRPRPELTKLTARLKLPEYLKYVTQPSIEVRGGAVSVLKGAEVQFVIESVREVAKATMDGEAEPLVDGRIETRAQKVADAAVERVFEWTDRLGLTPREPLKLKVQPVEDIAPRVVARRESLEQVVLDTEVVVFDVSAADDFGIQRMGLAWQPLATAAGGAKERRVGGGKIVAAGSPEMRQMEVRATFCAAREGIAPQSLEVRAWAEDYLSGRERAESAVFVLHVLNATDHALWLTQQMGKWLDVARETYEREQQLHQINQELRELSAAELDQPQNRRKISQQASAEQANAARLGSLNEAGRRLVEQATRNPEFDAERLESWATMLKALKDIAAKRMPSVAELLRQSSSAAAGAKPEVAESGEAGKPGEAGSGKPKDGKAPSAGGAGESKPEAPNLSQGPELAGKPGAGEGEAGDKAGGDKPPVPGVQVTEKSEPVAESKTGEGAAKPKPPSAGKLSLVSNTLGAAPKKPGEDAEPPPAETQAQDKLQKSIWEQRDLLKEFAQVTDQLNEILASLEASTFVKRLKAASREQLLVAGGLQKKTLEAFGLSPKATPVAKKTKDEAAAKPEGKVEPAKEPAEPEVLKQVLPTGEELAAVLEKQSIEDARALLAGKSQEQSEVVRVLQSDLDAYVQRRPDQHLKKVLGQMKATQVVRALAKVGEKTKGWMSGQAITGAEYWADTLDRWAEEMVAAGQCSACTAGDQDSLPPEIVLKVMQSLRDEMKLRDETRELENAKPALKAEEHTQRSYRLSSEQSRIAVQTQSAFDDILRLDGGPQKFGKELQLLGAVRHVMDEVVGILDQPDTGAPAIAAETEAIELLLQTKRQNPNGGGGGGSNPGGGGGSATASSTALAELGEGAEAEVAPEQRSVGQATGRAGKEFPEEFKVGLDAYFNQLESGRDEDE
jgi:hypothetical protein